VVGFNECIAGHKSTKGTSKVNLQTNSADIYGRLPPPVDILRIRFSQTVIQQHKNALLNAEVNENDLDLAGRIFV